MTRLNPLHCDVSLSVRSHLFIRWRGGERVEVNHLVAPAVCVSLGCGHMHLYWPVDPLLHALLTGFNSF